MNKKPLTDAEGEVRELDAQDMKHFKPLHEVLSPELVKTLSKPGRPKSAIPKEQVAVRFDVAVLAAFRASGKGWQTRMNAALVDWLKGHSPSEMNV